MKIEELKQKHSDIPEGLFCSADMHVKLSVKFALELLEDITSRYPDDVVSNILDKIEELKNYYKWDASTE